MKKTKSVAVIGHFGGKEHFNDGQTIKTVGLYNELKRATDWDIQIVDTYYKNSHPILLLLRTIYMLIRTQKVIILLSKNGLRFYLPLLYFFVKVRKTKVYHDVIGGNMAGYIDQHPKFAKYLNSFQINYVETEMLQEELRQKGVCNTRILPNFRRVQIVEESDLRTDYEEPYHFCTFSKVIREKGIEEAIQTIEELNAEAGRAVCCLDIYGAIGSDYRQRFNDIMKNSTKAISYRGEVSTEKAVDTIKNYYALLFPTHWLSESQAGCVSESFSAGVPVVATDWRCNHEMIRNGYNGVLYPSEQAQTLKEAIRWIISQKDSILEIKKNCRESAFYYQPDQYIKDVIAFIESK